MEETNQIRPNIPLSPDLVAKLQASAELLADISDDSYAQQFVQTLNVELYEEGLLGLSSEIKSMEPIWYAHIIREGNAILQPIFNKKILGRSRAKGIFIGVDYFISENEQRVLTYRVELGYDEQTESFLSMSAPVEHSSILFEKQAIEANQRDLLIAGNLRTLLAIKDEVFAEEIKTLVEIIDNFSLEDPSKIRELGQVTAWLLGHAEVRDNVMMRQALLNIVLHLCDHDGRFIIQGQEFFIDVVAESQRLIYTRETACEGTLQAVSAVDNFEIDVDGTTIFDDTLQPAFIVWDDVMGRERYLPLKHISDFIETTDDEIPTRTSGSNCDDTLNDYRNQFFKRDASSL